MYLQAKPGVTAPITRIVAGVVNKIHDAPALATEIVALVTYVHDIFVRREVVNQRKQWEVERTRKVSEAIARAMKRWDDDNYPRMLQATWSWHPFYPSFVNNLICATFKPVFPLLHSIGEGADMHAVLLDHSHVRRIYPVHWSVLLIRCFLKFYNLKPPLLSHPWDGVTDTNVTTWLKLAEKGDGFGFHAWQLATRHLKEEGFLLLAGARPVNTHEQWMAEVEGALEDLKSPGVQWWAELRMWCSSVQFSAVQDMAFHDKQLWLQAWVLRDRPSEYSAPLACYERWLENREDLDIGYVISKPGNL